MICNSCIDFRNCFYWDSLAFNLSDSYAFGPGSAGIGGSFSGQLGIVTGQIGTSVLNGFATNGVAFYFNYS